MATYSGKSAALDEVDGEHPIILFDGVCNLCNTFVQFVIERDPDGTFRFASLQSDIAEVLLSDICVERLDSLVLVTEDAYYTKSDAAIEIVTRFGGVYRSLVLSKLLPRPVRDRVYEYVATHRYDWFGKRDRCLMPSSDIESRFLE